MSKMKLFYEFEKQNIEIDFQTVENSLFKPWDIIIYYYYMNKKELTVKD